MKIGRSTDRRVSHMSHYPEAASAPKPNLTRQRGLISRVSMPSGLLPTRLHHANTIAAQDQPCGRTPLFPLAPGRGTIPLTGGGNPMREGSYNDIKAGMAVVGPGEDETRG